jgi:hypothetical protein
MTPTPQGCPGFWSYFFISNSFTLNPIGSCAAISTTIEYCAPACFDTLGFNYTNVRVKFISKMYAISNTCSQLLGEEMQLLSILKEILIGNIFRDFLFHITMEVPESIFGAGL